MSKVLVLIKNVEQLEYVQRHTSYLEGANNTFLIIAPEVWSQLCPGHSNNMIWANDCFEQEDIELIIKNMIEIRDNWCRDFETSLIYNNISLSELVRLDQTAFFMQVLEVHHVVNRIFEQRKFDKIALFGDSSTSCTSVNKLSDSNSVPRAVLLWEAKKRNMDVSYIKLKSHKCTEKQPEINNIDEIDRHRVFIENCWKNNNSKKLIAVGSSYDLLIMSPYVSSWNKKPGHEGLLLNDSTVLSNDTKRSGLAILDDVKFISFQDFKPDRQNASYQKVREHILDMKQKWLISRRNINEDDPLSNPYLNFQWESICNQLLILPEYIDRIAMSIEHIKPDVIMTDDLASAGTRAFVEVARNRGITTVDCPHGSMTELFLEYYEPHGDLFLAWGELQRKLLTERFPDSKSRIVVVGSPINEKIIKEKKSRIETTAIYQRLGISPEKKTICVPTINVNRFVNPVFIDQYFSGWKEIIQLSLRKDIQVVIRPHPTIDHTEYYKQLAEEYDDIVLCQELTLDEILPIIDLSIIFYHEGNPLLLFMHAEVPVILVLNKYSKIRASFPVFKKEGDIIMLTERYLYNQRHRTELVHMQKYFVDQRLYINDGDAVLRGVEAIDEVLRQRCDVYAAKAMG